MIEPADYAGLQDAWVTAALLAALLVVGAIALHGAADSARRRRRRGALPDIPRFTADSATTRPRGGLLGRDG